MSSNALRITMTLNWHRYWWVNLYLWLWSPVVILMLLVGLGCWGYVIVYLLGGLPVQLFFPFPMLFLGSILLVVMPVLTYFRIRQNFERTDHAKSDMIYTFDEEGMRVEGSDFEAVSPWRVTYKVVENRWWFLIYQNRAMANVLVKADMKKEEVEQLRELVNRVEGWH